MRCVIKGLHCFIILQVGAVGAFAQTLRRYTSLNHLAQAARAVLQNTSQINQMLTDLNRVDFANVQVSLLWERSGSVVECLTRGLSPSLTGVTVLWSFSKTHLS